MIVSRIPKDDHHKFTTDFIDAAKKFDILVEAHPISAYAGYRNNLYSRLLKEDGTWDDDISGLLDQVRLRSKDDGG
jgi:hypothetical protein